MEAFVVLLALFLILWAASYLLLSLLRFPLFRVILVILGISWLFGGDDDDS
ncbi:hypothetical protein [Magnetofaba australis]|uniref:hypothetical protein n=1 Tax=Magnetofaba australis TaxID=1472297 RepID=UPI001301B088|nr:hypothetical protein [Magnetofaba australis]